MDEKGMGHKGRSAKALGFGLLVLSGILWLAIPGVPFLPLSTEGKGIVVAALLILAEVAFWLGLVLVGKEYADRIRKIPGRIVAWFKPGKTGVNA